MRKRGARAAHVVKKVGSMPPEALGPWIYNSSGRSGQIGTGVDRNRRHMHGWRRGDRLPRTRQRFPDKVAADRMEEATEETFGLTILKPETIVTFTERSRLVPTRLQTEGVDLPSEKPRAASFCVDADSGAWIEQRPCLRHAEAGSLRRYTRRSERRFLVVHWTGGRMELLVWMNWKTELNMSLRISWTSEGDAEFESEIEAIVGALLPVEGSDAVEVLATRKQTRKAVTQEKLSRGWEHLCANAQTARQSAGTFPKPDLAELAGRTRTVGNLTMSAESVQRSAQASERTLACELVPAMFGEGCERGTVETLLVGTSRANEGDHSPCGSQRKRATLAFERAPGGVQVSQRQHSAFAGGSRTGMGFGREDNSLCGTRGS